jgi:hypothetical protein
MPHHTRARHVLQAIGVLAALWAFAIAATGGGSLSFGAFDLSSRHPRNAILIAVLAALAAWALARPHVRETLRSDADVWRRRARTASYAWRSDWSVILAGAVACGAAVLAVQQWAGARPLWLDEQMIALNLRERSVTALAGPLWLGQSAPFGWLAVERMILVTLGESERALRLVPLGFGLGTLVVAAWIARRWMRSAGAPLLLLLCATGQWTAYYVFELKHYSADVFWGLWLPALAAWAMEAEDAALRRRRAARWWTAAAIGHWVANGALLATPGCAAVLLVHTWRRHGWRDLRAHVPFAALALVSFLLHFTVAIRHTLGSTYLGEYWAFAFPPESAGFGGTLWWFATQLEPIARKPGGSEWFALFWLTAAAGWIVTSRRALGLTMASVPLAAFSLAALGAVPLFERLTLWAVPALYVGLALAADHAVKLMARGAAGGAHGRSVPALVFGLVLLLSAGVVGIDIVRRGHGELRRDIVTTHRLDDRTGVEWLMFNRRPGDAVITTELALPAVWWYGRIPVGEPSAGGRLPDGSRILEVGYREAGDNCDTGALRTALEGHRRALVYFGFSFDDVPRGFDRLLLEELSRLGTVRALQRFTDAGRAVLFELGEPMEGGWGYPVDLLEGADPPPPLEGCLDVGVARRW